MKKIFPDSCGFINVKKYGAKGDGVTDDTLAIIRAIQENIGFTNLPRTIYFPPGIYIVSETLFWRLKNVTTDGWKGWRAYLNLQGSGRDFTTIKIKDNTPGFGDPTNPKAVIYTGSGN